MKGICFLLLLLGGCRMVQAQGVLKGRVTTTDTHKPVALANVYLSNTAIGTLTNDNGEFTLSAFPPGRYELVVSYIGYETYTVPLFSSRLPSFLNIVLKPKVNMLQEVILIPYEKNGWEKWGVFFADNFIGTSAFAQQCSLLNKEAVKFRFDKKKNLLQAFADETLLFENSALGYKIKYDLISFEYDFTQRLFVYKGYPFFEEMQTSRKGLQRRWAQRREDAYKGSLMQFMRSLYRNRLVEDGFQVRRLIKIPDAEKKRVRDIYRMAIQKPQADGRMMISNAFDAFPADTAAYYRQVLQEPDKLNVLIDRVLPGDSIAYAVDSVTAGLYFTEHLQVIYPSKNMPDEFFSKYVVSSHPVLKKPVTSEATIITGQPINVLANGSYYEGTGLIISGYWGWWEKIGNMLPYNYEPPRPLKNKGTYFIKRPSDYHFWK